MTDTFQIDYSITTPTNSEFNDSDNFGDDDWQWDERLRLINEFDNWTSGNDKLDRFIQQTQLENPDPNYHLQWIPFENFGEVKFLEKGGFSSVFSGTLLNKTEQVWCKNENKFIERPLVVALKSLKNSQNLGEDFLDEIKRHGSLKLDGCRNLIHCHGMSKSPETNEFMMVMDFADEGNLRNYLRRNMRTLKWKDVLEILSDIAMGLMNIHKNGTFHKNLHCGNILKYSTFNIADFGLSGPSGTSDPKGAYGSLPLIAPEVLTGESFTGKSDIYSFAFIMWELSSGRPPLSDRPHDHSLALEICNGFRESIVTGTPFFYEQLMKRCWDADPHKRPDAEELVNILTTPNAFHRRLLGLDENSLDVNDFDSFDEVLNSYITNEGYPVAPDIHPFAIYTSDLLLFPNLPTPTNSISISNSSDEDGPISSSSSSVNNNNKSSSEVDSAFEEYNTNFPPPELSEPETDTEEDEEVFIPPPSFQITRRKSIAPQLVLRI